MEKTLLILMTFIYILLLSCIIIMYKNLKEYTDKIDSYIRSNDERHRPKKLSQLEILYKLNSECTSQQRQIFVFNPLYKKWELTDFERLHDGDLFKIILNGVRYTDPSTGDNIWVANGDPYKGSSGYPEIKTYY